MHEETPVTIADDIKAHIDAHVEVAKTIPLPKPKRKYTEVAKGDFIKIANASQSAKEISDKTGMSYAGVRLKLRNLKAGNVALKKCLFEDGRKKK